MLTLRNSFLRPSYGGILGSILLAATGCAAGGQSEGAQSPAPSSDAPPAKEKTQGSSAKETPGPAPDVLYPAHVAVPQAPQACNEGQPLPPPAQCSDARPALAVALSLKNNERDSALKKLESCSDFPRGLLRALRAELAPAECADRLVEPLVGKGNNSQTISQDIRESLVALGLGARLRRLAIDPPAAPTSKKKDALQDYFKTDLFPWIGQQAQAIFVMASQGTQLTGYARGIVAIEAGNADMRFVEIARAVPIADEFAQHQEARDLYYANLDQELEPRKNRGRNGALAGLAAMASQGIRQSERVASARALLSRAYGGRRVNALDTLFLAPLSPQKAETDAAGIASRVPAPYASTLLGRVPLTAHLVRAQVQMGMTTALRRQIESEGDAPSRLLLARALFESGRTYFRATDFQAAQALLTEVLDSQESLKELTSEQRAEASLVRALSIALLAGPKNAAEMISQGPRFAQQLGNLVILDGLAEKKNEVGGRAAFNAAYLRELIAPSGAPNYWTDLSARYSNASKHLLSPEKRLARERAQACSDIARTLKKQIAEAKKRATAKQNGS